MSFSGTRYAYVTGIDNSTQGPQCLATSLKSVRKISGDK